LDWKETQNSTETNEIMILLSLSSVGADSGKCAFAFVAHSVCVCYATDSILYILLLKDCSKKGISNSAFHTQTHTNTHTDTHKVPGS